MTLHGDDPRLTGYLLGELSDAEHLEISRAIEASAELRKTVSEIQKTIQNLDAHFRNEPSLELRTGQKDFLQRKIREHGAPVRFPAIRIASWGTAAMIAAVALFVIFPGEEILEPPRKNLAFKTDASLPPPVLLAELDTPIPTPQKLKEETSRAQSGDTRRREPYQSTDLGSEKKIALADSLSDNEGSDLGMTTGSGRFDVRGEMSPLAKTRAKDLDEARQVPATVAAPATAGDALSPAGSPFAAARRYLEQGLWPPAEAVPLREWINAVPWSATPPQGAGPITVTLEMAPCPWQGDHFLLRVAIKINESLESVTPFDMQFEVNPALVSAYRFIGHEETSVIPGILKFPGTPGDPQFVFTTLMEIIPAPASAGTSVPADAPWMVLKIKDTANLPAAGESFPLFETRSSLQATSTDWQFTASVAALGLALHRQAASGDGLALDWSTLLALARAHPDNESHPQIAEFLNLIHLARELDQRTR